MKLYFGDGKSAFISNERKYIKEIFLPGSKHVNNSIFKELVEQIGKIHGASIKGNNSIQHKGLKKIIQHCYEQKKIKLTNREIKSLFGSKEKLDNGLTKISIKCPYEISAILHCIIELIERSPEVLKFCCNEAKAKNIVGSSYVVLLAPDYETAFRSYYKMIVDWEIKKKKAYRLSEKSKIKKTVDELETIKSLNC